MARKISQIYLKNQFVKKMKNFSQTYPEKEILLMFPDVLDRVLNMHLLTKIDF